jgi:hypothetical protein
MYEDETRSRLSRIFRPEKIVVADFPLAWFKEFTVPELFTLATHKLPSTEQIETMWREQASISFPYGGVSLTLLTGMVLIQLGTLVVFAYFWLFYREARRSQTFPAGATVFGALSRTRISRALFVVFLASPPAVAFIVASRTLWVAQSTPIGGVVNAAIALLILLVALAIRRHPLPRSMAS